MKKIFVTQPSMAPLEEFIPYLEKIWHTKILTNGGEFHKELEAQLTNYLNVKNISLFNNATVALITALQALRVTGEVITTPFSFVATSHSILWNGSKPVFVDIDRETLNIDASKIESAITPKTTAILAVHCYGNPCDTEKIENIAARNNLKVIYDAAHAFGVEVNGNSVLNNGNMSILSFHATKVFNTFEGGAIITKTKFDKNRIDSLKNFGIVDETTVNMPGINGKMSEINAAFGLAQLKHIDDQIEKRKIVDQSYREMLKNHDGIECVKRYASKDNYSYFPILIDKIRLGGRERVYQQLRDSGINARRYFYPLITHFPMYSGIDSAQPKNLPVAEMIAEKIICLPIYPDLDEQQIQEITKIVVG